MSTRVGARPLAWIALTLTLACLLPSAGTSAYTPAQGRTIDSMPHILDERDRVGVINRVLVDRLDNMLPELMRETDIDMWIVINREYAEDPVYKTLVPEPVFAARRTTMLVMFDQGADEGVERLTVSRYALGGLFEPAWDGGSLAEQWTRLADVVRERDPKRIGINMSKGWAFGDGLSAGLHAQLTEALGPELSKRLVSAEALCVRWLETRSAQELELYPQIVAIARRVIAEAFSSDVITPGATTTDDVAWYIRQRFEDLNVQPWFQPYVNVQRKGMDYDNDDAFFGESGVTIERGDVLHTDVGICYLRLCTDTQEMGYVLRPGEDAAPAGLAHALLRGNQWQDHLTNSYKSGRTGNQILRETRKAADADGLNHSVYTHPLGYFGHAAGPTIGMWDNQGDTPLRGDWKLFPDTAYAIEGSIKIPVPEWDDQWVQIKLEQDAVFDGEKVWYIAGRQTLWHLVR